MSRAKRSDVLQRKRTAIQMFHAGWDKEHIASELGVSVATVRSYLRGLKRRKLKPKDAKLETMASRAIVDATSSPQAAAQDSERQALRRSAVMDIIRKPQEELRQEIQNASPDSPAWQIDRMLLDEVERIAEYAENTPVEGSGNIADMTTDLIALRVTSLAQLVHRTDSMTHEGIIRNMIGHISQIQQEISQVEGRLPVSEELQKKIDQMKTAAQHIRSAARAHPEASHWYDPEEIVHNYYMGQTEGGERRRYDVVLYSAIFNKDGRDIFVNPHMTDGDYDFPELVGGDILKKMVVDSAARAGLDLTDITIEVFPQEKGWVDLGYRIASDLS